MPPQQRQSLLFRDDSSSLLFLESPPSSTSSLMTTRAASDDENQTTTTDRGTKSPSPSSSPSASLLGTSTTTTTRVSESQRLGIVLDLDGTLVAENSDDTPKNMLLRPGALEFLAWAKARGHGLAIWTAAHASWAHYVAWLLCRGVATEQQQNAQHDCQGASCQHTFDFCWSRDRLRSRQYIPVAAHLQTAGCRWCSSSSMCANSSSRGNNCDSCDNHSIWSCPCRSTKPLTKVWKRYRKQQSQQHDTTDQQHSSAAVFGRRERTLMIENTPQQCRDNYGNAIYVPTYWANKKQPAAQEESTELFQRLKRLIVELENCPDVRNVSKCCTHDEHVGYSAGVPYYTCCLEQQSRWQQSYYSPTASMSSSSSSSDDADDAAPLFCLPVGTSSSTTVATTTTTNDAASTTTVVTTTTTTTSTTVVATAALVRQQQHTVAAARQQHQPIGV